MRGPFLFARATATRRKEKRGDPLMNADEREWRPADEDQPAQGPLAEESLRGPCAPAGCL